MLNFLKVFFLLIVSILLASCGGGGGGGGSSSGGTPAPVATDTLSLSTGAVSFTVIQYENTPDPIRVTARITGSNTAGIAFGTLPGVDSLPPWLNIELGTLANNSVDAVFNITTSDIPAGTYTFTVRAVTFDSAERELDRADVVVTFEVVPGVPLSVSPESVDVVMHYASDPTEQVMSVIAGNYEWAAFSSDANLDIDSAIGTQDVTLSIFPPMEDIVDDMGIYQGVVDVFQNGTSNNVQFFINFTMFPTLDATENELFFNGVEGSSREERVGVNLIGQGLNWSASSDVPWISFSAPSGIIETEDDIIDSPEGDDFIAIFNSSSLSVGRHEGVITVTAEAEQSLEIAVVVEVASQKLEPLDRGVALSQTASTSKLQSVIDINTNTERLANWTASTDAAWLSVTASGTVDDDLTITADPMMVMDETFSEAVVTIASPDAEIMETEVVRVGFWKSAMMPAGDPVRVGDMFPEDLIVADPIRPLAYVHSGEREINIVNTYSGAIEKTLTPEAQVFNFDVSDDGASLFLVRSGEDEGFIDVVDLNTQDITTTWTYAVERLSARDTQEIVFGRITNRPYLFTSTGVIINAETGEIETLSAGASPSGSDVKGNVFCSQGQGVSDAESELSCFDLVSAGFEGARLRSVGRGETTAANGQVILAHDGSRAFNIASRSLALIDTSDLSEIVRIETDANDFFEDAVIDSEDNLYVTYANEGEIPTEPGDPMTDPKRFINIYNRDLVLIRTVDYPTSGDGFLPILSDTTLSGDDQRVVYLTSDEFLEVNFFSLN